MLSTVFFPSKTDLIFKSLKRANIPYVSICAFYYGHLQTTQLHQNTVNGQFRREDLIPIKNQRKNILFLLAFR